MVTLLQLAGLALALVLLVALHYRLGDLPVAVWSEARRERAADAPKAIDLMKEAVAIKAGASVIAIQRYEEGLAASFRAEVANAEMRARVSERRAADTVTALAAATTLVGELRQVIDRLPIAAPPGGASASDPAERETVEIRPEGMETARKPGVPCPASRERPSPRVGLPSASASPEDDQRLSEDELTKVADRPRSGFLAKTLVSPGGKSGES